MGAVSIVEGVGDWVLERGWVQLSVALNCDQSNSEPGCVDSFAEADFG